MLVDSHCHLDKLDLTPYGGQIEPVLAQASKRGIDHVLCIGIDLEGAENIVALADQHPNVYATVGVHPLYRERAEPTVDALLSWARHSQVVGIGETGLDYFYGEGDLTWQRDRFAIHIEAASRTGLPLVIHTRGAKEDTLAYIKPYAEQGGRGVLHCFTEDLDMAKKAVELGFMISISGIVTFRNAADLRDVVAALPLESLLVETDAPWLAPVPYRGKKNEPQYVLEVAEKIAEIKGVSLERVAEVTTHNFFTLFNKASI